MGGQWLGRSTVAIVALGLSAEAVLAETLVGPTPEIFAPGVVSAGANDGAPTFSPDGRTLYFERTNSKWTAILESRLTPRGWTKPVLAAFSGETSDQQPSLSPDGRYLVFVSSRPLPAAEAAPPRFANHLYRVDRLANGWSKARELPATVNLSNRVFKPSVAANGDLYFMADVGPGGAPKWRLFFARAVGQTYAPAQALPFSGLEDGDVDPFIAPDQSYLVFSSNTRGVLKDGHEHLFMVRREGAGWSAIRPLRYAGDDLGQDDGEAQVGPDGRWLYFTSSRIIPMAKVHDRQTAQRALERMNVWDNSNGNAWRLPFATLIAAERL